MNNLPSKNAPRAPLCWAAALFAVLSLGLAGPVQAQGVNLTGHWRGIAMGVQIDLVVMPNQDFTETQRMGTVMTMQQGHIDQFGSGLVHMTIVNWAPQTRPVYHPTGTVGGYYTQEPLVKPPGGTWRVTFHSSTNITMQDINLGGAINLQRIE